MKLEAFRHWIGRNWQWLVSVYATLLVIALSNLDVYTYSFVDQPVKYRILQKFC